MWNPAKGHQSTECDFPERRKGSKTIKVFISERQQLNEDSQLSKNTINLHFEEPDQLLHSCTDCYF